MALCSVVVARMLKFLDAGPSSSETSGAVAHNLFGVSVPQYCWDPEGPLVALWICGCGMNEGNELIAIMASLSGSLN